MRRYFAAFGGMISHKVYKGPQLFSLRKRQRTAALQDAVARIRVDSPISSSSIFLGGL